MEATASEILANLTEQEIDALVEVMLLAACADGSLDYAETVVLKKSLRGVDIGWLSHVDLEERMAQVKLRIVGESRDARLAELRTMLPWPEQRILALKLAIRIASVDGSIQPSEREVILRTAEALGIRSELAVELVNRTV